MIRLLPISSQQKEHQIPKDVPDAQGIYFQRVFIGTLSELKVHLFTYVPCAANWVGGEPLAVLFPTSEESEPDVDTWIRMFSNMLPENYELRDSLWWALKIFFQ